MKIGQPLKIHMEYTIGYKLGCSIYGLVTEPVWFLTTTSITDSVIEIINTIKKE
jgi:hypothetical protein